MPKSICVPCEVELKPQKNGVYVLELSLRNTTIYRIWQADMWICPICGHETVIGFAQLPTHRYDKDYQLVLNTLRDGKETIILDYEYPYNKDNFDKETLTRKEA
jgi:hypothetical protein